MKILHLIQKPQLRGAEIFTSQLSTHINNTGHKAIIVPVFEGSAALPFNGEIIHLNGTQKNKYWDVKAWKKLAQIVKDQQPDVVQANAGDTLRYAVFSKMFFGWSQPIVLRNASTISLYIKKGLAKKWYGFFFSKAEKIISVSNTSAADFEALYPGLKNRIVHIPIGIETLNLPDRRRNQVMAVKQNEGPKLVHVGGFSFEKNHKGLLSIFQKLLQKCPYATLHLVGGGMLQKEMEAFVNQKGLENKVVFYGFQKEPLQYIQNADVLLLPSIIEGLPGVILEAFYCKTPVVAYDVGGIKEVIINGETGRLVAKGDEERFVDQILQALEKNSHNETLIENAYKLVTSNYLNTQITNQFLNIYKELTRSYSTVPENQN